MKYLFFLLTICTFLSCSTAKFVATGMTDSKKLALSPNSKVYVITEIPKEAKKVLELGICYATVPGGGIVTDNTDKAIEKLKQCARENGGNAILLKNNKEGGYHTAFGYSQQTAKAEALVYYIEL